MLDIRRRVLSTALVLTLLPGGQMALAQSSRAWVDPPSDLKATPSPPQLPEPPPSGRSDLPRPPSPQPDNSAAAQPAQPAPRTAPAPPPPVVTAQPEPRPDKGTDRATAARQLAIAYLHSWSAPNEVTLEATSEFYAPWVLFHGKVMSARTLFREKRRFVRRWPAREYRPHEDTMKVACDPGRDFCTVQSLFDFTAANPRRGRISQGSAALQLVVSFAGERPLISAESSMILDRDRSKRRLTWEGASND
jgi:hypothetical protein